MERPTRVLEIRGGKATERYEEVPVMESPKKQFNGAYQLEMEQQKSENRRRRWAAFWDELGECWPVLAGGVVVVVIGWAIWFSVEHWR